MISHFFIQRPIFAWVISILIMMCGAGAILVLPIEQYPNVAPPSVNVGTSYPGASAETLDTSVTQVIEQQLTGIDGLLYFTSTSSAQGWVGITATFEKGTDPDTAQVQVQNKVQQALPRLPQAVQQQGVSVTKSNPDFLLVGAIYDTTGRSTNNDIADFMVSNFQDSIGRLPGVGALRVFGAQYAMRIWLNPFQLASYRLMPSDVRRAVEEQNIQVAAGQVGGQPAPAEQMLNAMMTAKSRMTTAEEFRNIIVKNTPEGGVVRLRDVARVELGSEDYNIVTHVNRHPGAGMGIQLAPGADALKTAEIVKKAVAERAERFPDGYVYAFPTDSTVFIRRSISGVVETLLEAIVLVVLVMFAFLQNWRATLIPTIAVPVVLLGTFGVLALFGFTVNTLTLFGLVLAIGLLVDDAIVVVENVERVMRENPGMDARQATIRSMSEIQTALIAIALVLSAVFLPMAFLGGSTGVIYRQFSVTIISSMVLSVVVAIVLTPALTASILRPHDAHDAASARGFAVRLRGAIGAPFASAVNSYRRGVSVFIGRRGAFMLVYLALSALMGWLFVRLPTSFLPNEDQGSMVIQYTLPVGATQNRAVKVAGQIEDYFFGNERANVGALFTVTGFGFSGSGQNTGMGFMSLQPWEQRVGEDSSVEALAARANQGLAGIRDANVFALTPPPIQGLGASSGFSLELLNSGGLPPEEFKARRDELLEAAKKDPVLAAVRPSGLEDIPTVHVDIDEEKVGALGISRRDVYDTLSAAWGGAYINDFVDRGRVKRVYMQAEGEYRAAPGNLNDWHVRSASGEMASFASFATTTWSSAPAVVSRFNGLQTYQIQGQAAPGRSSGEAMARIAELASKRPGTSVGWSGLSFQERLADAQAPVLYALSLVVVFLCLAALYESWSVPLAVLLVVPLGLLGAVLGVTARGLHNDIFFQVGVLTTIGLSAKNAILVVEFAEQAERRGDSPTRAALEAARQRLRPILMTSLAFMFGVMPLVFSSGAGARGRIAIGTTVLGGMLAATLLTIYFVPMFFVLLRRGFRGDRAEDSDKSNLSIPPHRLPSRTAPSLGHGARSFSLADGKPEG